MHKISCLLLAFAEGWQKHLVDFFELVHGCLDLIQEHLLIALRLLPKRIVMRRYEWRLIIQELIVLLQFLDVIVVFNLVRLRGLLIAAMK